MKREEIQNRILSNISNQYDKSHGSFFYDTISPVAIELENQNEKLKTILDKAFVETASGEYLDKRALEQGLTRKLATKSSGIVQISGLENALVEKGIIVSSDTVNFIVQENKKIDSSGRVDVLVECEKEGSLGNIPGGAIKYFPVTISGLTSVSNLNSITNGYDGESDEELRNRYFEKIKAPSTSGNKFHYISWAKEIVGVGDAQCIPLWNGNGTVKVVIADSNKRAANSELIKKVKDYIEEQRPIGADVTVVSAAEKFIDIAASIKLAQGYNIGQVQGLFEKAVTEYFKEISFVESYISIAKIGNILLRIQGVLDYSDLKLNNDVKNISLKESENSIILSTPILNLVSLGVL